METVTSRAMTRRAWLLVSAASLSCGRKKATGFPGYCLVADPAGRSVVAVSLERFRIEKRIALGAPPAALAAVGGSAEPRAYALAPEAGAVFEIDAAGLAARRRVSAGNRAIAFRVAPDGAALWILYRDPPLLAEARLNSFRIARRVWLPGPPDAFELSETGLAAVACGARRSIFLVSLAGGAIERTIPAGVTPSLARFRKDGRVVLAGSALDRCLVVFDVATGKTIARLPLPVAPHHFAATPDGGQLFVSGDGADAVAIVFPYSVEIDQSILAGHAPGDMAVTGASPSYLLVANPLSAGVTILDVDMRRLVAVARVGEGPGEILITPDNQYALVIGRQSADLAVIRLATLSEATVRRYKSAPLFTMVSLGGQPAGAAIVRMGT